MTRYRAALLAAFAMTWIWAAINPHFPQDWLLENILVVIFVPLLLLAGRYFKLSDTSYTLITSGQIIHLVGAHYTYSEVPFGYTLQQWFGADRNMYDRLVHFSFGLLMAYPVREVFMRVARVRGFWALYFPLDLTFAFSAIYEIIEWIAAACVDPAAGIAFLGTQGDVWDAQKDMLLAGLGAFIAMCITAAVNFIFDPNFKHELRDSLRIEKGDAPLGEQRLKELVTRRR
jgi:putative membrane protein